eukprot:CAMPEP_0173145984 /NCGR_PEP_ID=MMETSP1105-20130129/8216_1 /TAXON_ID=2985 /ORGANISM="Ochromonas sp., Strain BG-1" /LENGTH=1052 /DNA_ID=CAMNT_0014060085 /DNA_START=31 /DNA_END=3189 /DNA_ORIENTATION=+
MFSFLRQKSSNDHSDHKDVPPSPSQGSQPAGNSASASSFSFLNAPSNGGDTLFGGMNVSDTPTASSGFSFLQSGGDDHHNEARAPSNENHSSDPVSSFSFLNESTTTATPTKTEAVSSGFSFLSEPVKAETTPEIETHPNPARRDSKEDQVQDLKLSKVAVTKQVKKKKKASRVGSGRDEDEDIPNRRLSASELESITEHHEQQEIHESHTTITETVISSVSTHDIPDDVKKHTAEITETHVAEPVSVSSMPVISEPATETVETDHTEVEEQPTTNNSIPAPESSAFSFLSQSITPSGVQTQLSPVIPTEAVPEISQPEPNPEVNPISKPITSILEQFDKYTPSPASTSSKETKTKIVEKTEGVDSTPTFQVPVSLSGELKTIDTKLQSGFNKIRSNYLQSYSLQQAILHQIDSLSSQSNQLREKISLLESKQTALALIEDFEQADAISIEIESTQRELEYKNHEKSNLLQKLEDLRLNYTQEKQNLVEELFRNLNNLFITCTETQSSVDAFNDKLKEYSDEEKSRLAVEQQRVEMERNHCEREQQSLNNESQVIEDAIKNQVGDYYVKQEALESQIATVQEEIKILEEQLALKRVFEADLSKSLKQIESKIQEARKKFDRQLQRIQERLDTLQKAQRECQQEEDLLAQNRFKVESILERAHNIVKEAQTLTEQKLQEKNLVHLVIEDLRAYSERHHQNVHLIPSIGLEASWEAFDILQSNSDAANPKVKAKRDEINEAESELAKIRGVLTDTRIQYDSKVAKQKSLVDQIEQLELAKKLHAANKRFKEAAATAKELKELSETKEQVEKDVQSNYQIIVEQEEQEEINVRRLDELQLELQEEQKIEKEQHINKLSNRILDVKILIRKLEKSHQALLSTSNETSGILEESIQLYQAELQQLVNLRDDLCRKNGIEIPLDEIVEEEEEAGENNQAEVVIENIEIQSDVIVTEEVISTDAVNEVLDEIVDQQENVDEEAPIEIVETVVESTAIEEAVEELVPEIDVEAIQNEITALEVEMQIAADNEDFEKVIHFFVLLITYLCIFPGTRTARPN